MAEGSRVSPQELIALSAQAHGLSLPVHRSQLQASGHCSIILGRGMEYAESRRYEAGDDARMIDWRVTARTGTAYTKVFREDRRRQVHLVTDMRTCMRFGTRKAFKSVVAAQAAALAAWAAHLHGDPVSLIVLADHGLVKLPPAASKGALLRHLKRLSAATTHMPKPDKTQAAADFSGCVKQIRPGDLTLMMSDMSDLPADVVRGLEYLNQCRLVMVCWILDPLERQALPAGHYPITDGVKFTTLRLTSKRRIRELQRLLDDRRETIERTLKRLNVPVLELDCGDSVAGALYRAFHRGSQVQRWPIRLGAQRLGLR